jgi:tRNA G18 (ribose-2'-O)-methylase SpoU
VAPGSSPIAIGDAADPRLADYTALTDAELRRRLEVARGVFIVEGRLAIESLLRSRYAVRSVLVSRRMHDRLARALAGVEAPVYVVDDHVLRATVGFDLHRGAVASAHRPPAPDLDPLIRSGSRLLVLEGVNDHENIGALFRNAAAFGVDAVLLDATCADPLYRRSVRVSLGHVLHVPFTPLVPWPHAIERLHGAGWTTVALTPSGDETIAAIAAAAPHRVALLVGAEGPGLSAGAIAAAHHRVRIPLAAGVDSLNVATAAAIALYALSPR